MPLKLLNAFTLPFFTNFNVVFLKKSPQYVFLDFLQIFKITIIYIVSLQSPLFFIPVSIHPCNPYFFGNLSYHSSTSHHFVPSLICLYLTSKFMSLRPRTFNFMYHNKIKKLLQCHELLVCQNENEKLITQYNILKYNNIYIYMALLLCI